MSWTMPETEKAYHQELDDENINPLWVMHANPPERPKIEPYVWRWERMRELAMQAGALESLKGQGFRRALTMRNPGLKNPQAGATKTMSAAVQIVWPGEIAEAHRHTAAAIRFVIEGEGAFTVQDGERFRMEAGDLTLTPSWAWHDHNNPEDKPVIWLDCLDAPMVGYFDAMFQEPYPEDVQPITKPVGYTNASIGNGLMRANLNDVSGGTLPITYKWNDAYGALLGYGEEDRFDGVLMEYANPGYGRAQHADAGAEVAAAGPRLPHGRPSPYVQRRLSRCQGRGVLDHRGQAARMVQGRYVRPAVVVVARARHGLAGRRRAVLDERPADRRGDGSLPRGRGPASGSRRRHRLGLALT